MRRSSVQLPLWDGASPSQAPPLLRTRSDVKVTNWRVPAWSAAVNLREINNMLKVKAPYNILLILLLAAPWKHGCVTIL